MKNKDAYYFPHDSNAKDDPKCVLLIEQQGPEGYGIYWILLETLRDQPGWRCPLSIIPGLARRYNTSKEKMMDVIQSYSLFEIEGDEFFFSEAFTRRMRFVEEKRKKLSDAGVSGNLVRWKKGNDQVAIAGRSGSDQVAIASKGKEIKQQEINVPTKIKASYQAQVTAEWKAEQAEQLARLNGTKEVSETGTTPI